MATARAGGSLATRSRTTRSSVTTSSRTRSFAARGMNSSVYPGGVDGWLTKVDVDPNGGISLDPRLFVEFGDRRPHQIRLEGGDASSDSYCYP